jgi:hypothetical protein
VVNHCQEVDIRSGEGSPLSLYRETVRHGKAVVRLISSSAMMFNVRSKRRQRRKYVTRSSLTNHSMHDTPIG